MSESGEISEFGYIMELLARGKVSAGARGAAAGAPTPGSTWPGAVRVPVPSSARGGRGWNPGSARSARASGQLQNAK